MRLTSGWCSCICVLCIGSISISTRPSGDRPVTLHQTDTEAVASPSIEGHALMQASLRRSHSQLPLSPENVAAPAPPIVLAPPPSPSTDSAALVTLGTAPVWAPEEATLPNLDDSTLSSPALLAYMVSQAVKHGNHATSTNSGAAEFLEASTKVVHGQQQTMSTAMATWLSQYWASISMGFLVFICGMLVLWFNELRSVKMDTLLSRGISECESIDADKVSEETLGCLVHVVGQTSGIAPVEDPQFMGVSIENCLKLQSTVEVYEWVQTVKIGQPTRSSSNPHEKKNNVQYTFHKEWATVHRNSLQFQRSAGKPSPDNPRPPRGLNLGTFTSVSKNVKLGSFTLPEDMIDQFKTFEPAMQYMPPTVQACGLMFYADKDGYFYSRPSMRSMWSTKAGPSIEPAVGDLRVRFLCVPQGIATVVAVHCEKEGKDTFVPFRAIPRGCCSNELQDRARLVEEGSRSLTELKITDEDMAPCMETNRMALSCFCCPCTSIQRVCTKEVVTEEIYFVSEEHAAREKPFEWVVPRSFWRVWFFRAAGWLLCYLSCLSLMGTLQQAEMKSISGFQVYGSWAPAVLCAIMATAASTFVIAGAYLCYSPSQSFKWACAMGAVVALPFIVGHLHESMA